MSHLSELAAHVISQLSDGCRRYWPILLSTGLLILELRRLRAQLENINQDFIKIIENCSSGSGRIRSRINSISG